MKASSKLAWIALIAGIAVPALAQSGSTPYVYLRSNANQPWGQTTNEDAMDNEFGSGNWTTQYYETISAASLLSSSTLFIFMEGGDSSFASFQSFMIAHGDARTQADGTTAGDGTITAWIQAGGRLLIMSAPNDPLNSATVYLPGSITLWADAFYNSAASIGEATDNSSPIFTSPHWTSGSLSGDFVAHGYFTGSSMHLLMKSDLNEAILGRTAIGHGLMMFGGMTTDNFHEPQPGAHYLLENIIDYTAHVATN